MRVQAQRLGVDRNQGAIGGEVRKVAAVKADGHRRSIGFMQIRDRDTGWLKNWRVKNRRLRNWCPREDSNLHGFHHWYLKPARLPIPPPGPVFLIGGKTPFCQSRPSCCGNIACLKAIVRSLSRCAEPCR